MLARDIMTATVVTVTSDARVEDIAKLLLDKHISAVPVVDSADRLVGMVSEGDLMRRRENETERHRSWWLNLLTTPGAHSGDMRNQGRRKVEDVMSRDVLLASETDDLQSLIALLSKRRIKRLPVVRDGKLVGIVSRVDILRHLAREKVVL